MKVAELREKLKSIDIPFKSVTRKPVLEALWDTRHMRKFLEPIGPFGNYRGSALWFQFWEQFIIANELKRAQKEYEEWLPSAGKDDSTLLAGTILKRLLAKPAPKRSRASTRKKKF